MRDAGLLGKLAAQPVLQAFFVVDPPGRNLDSLLRVLERLDREQLGATVSLAGRVDDRAAPNERVDAGSSLAPELEVGANVDPATANELGGHAPLARRLPVLP